MSNWYKRSWNQGIPIMDEYSMGLRPPAANYKRDPQSLVHARPEFGGNKRQGYPKNISLNPDNEDTSSFEKIREKIPSKYNLLIEDGGDSRDGLGERFVAQDEFGADNDKLPIGVKENLSVRLDAGPDGPNNMQRGDVFKAVKKDTGPSYSKNIFKKIKKDTTLKGLKM